MPHAVDLLAVLLLSTPPPAVDSAAEEPTRITKIFAVGIGPGFGGTGAAFGVNLPASERLRFAPYVAVGNASSELALDIPGFGWAAGVITTYGGNTRLVLDVCYATHTSDRLYIGGGGFYDSGVRTAHGPAASAGFEGVHSNGLFLRVSYGVALRVFPRSAARSLVDDRLTAAFGVQWR